MKANCPETMEWYARLLLRWGIVAKDMRLVLPSLLGCAAFVLLCYWGGAALATPKALNRHLDYATEMVLIIFMLVAAYVAGVYGALRESESRTWWLMESLPVKRSTLILRKFAIALAATAIGLAALTAGMWIVAQEGTKEFFRNPGTPATFCMSVLLCATGLLSALHFRRNSIVAVMAGIVAVLLFLAVNRWTSVRLGMRPGDNLWGAIGVAGALLLVAGAVLSRRPIADEFPESAGRSERSRVWLPRITKLSPFAFPILAGAGIAVMASRLLPDFNGVNLPKIRSTEWGLFLLAAFAAPGALCGVFLSTVGEREAFAHPLHALPISRANIALRLIRRVALGTLVCVAAGVFGAELFGTSTPQGLGIARLFLLGAGLGFGSAFAGLLLGMVATMRLSALIATLLLGMAYALSFHLMVPMIGGVGYIGTPLPDTPVHADLYWVSFALPSLTGAGAFIAIARTDLLEIPAEGRRPFFVPTFVLLLGSATAVLATPVQDLWLLLTR